VALRVKRIYRKILGNSKQRIPDQTEVHNPIFANIAQLSMPPTIELKQAVGFSVYIEQSGFEWSGELRSSIWPKRILLR
jgi:hypothetical protein